MKYAIGTAIKQEITTSFKKSLDNIFHTLKIDAPNTLRTPISFFLCSATNDVNPNSPKQLIKIANAVNTPESVPIRSSDANF